MELHQSTCAAVLLSLCGFWHPWCCCSQVSGPQPHMLLRLLIGQHRTRCLHAHARHRRAHMCWHDCAAVATASGLLHVSLHSLAAARARTYTWAVSTSIAPSGLSIKQCAGGSLVVTTNATRVEGAAVTVASGVVRLTNHGASPLHLTEVYVLLQQPQQGLLLPIRALADCARSRPDSQQPGEGDASPVTLHAGAVLSCPFAVQLPHASSTAVSVVGKAQLASGSLASSEPGSAWHSSVAAADAEAGGGGGGSPGLALGRCAVVTETFESSASEGFLTPSAIQGGLKLPDLGAGTAVCASNVQSVYRIAFNSTDAKLGGTFKVSGPGCSRHHWASVRLSRLQQLPT